MLLIKKIRKKTLLCFYEFVNFINYTGETTRHLAEDQCHRKYLYTNTSKENFKAVLSTTHTKIGEAVIYKAVPIDRRLNANRPGFELKLF